MNDKVDFHFVNVYMYIYIFLEWSIMSHFEKGWFVWWHSIYIDTRGVIYGMLIIQLGRHFARDAWILCNWPNLATS